MMDNVNISESMQQHVKLAGDASLAMANIDNSETTSHSIKPNNPNHTPCACNKKTLE